MKLIHPNTLNPTSTTQFIHLNFKNHQTINLRKAHKFSIFTPLALKTPPILQQPPKHNHTITSSQQQKQQKNQINNINPNKNNTIIDVSRLMYALKLVVTPDIYATLLYECTRNRDVEQALGLYNHIKSAIVNNCNKQCYKEVIMIFQEMRKAGVRMNEYTFSSVLKASGRVGDDGSFGQQVHANAIKIGVDTHVFVLCGLIDLYGKWGLLKEAKRVFDMGDDGKRNSACWNAMVSGYMSNGLYFDALKMLYQMKGAGLKPKQSMVDEVRLACGGMKL